MKDSRRNRWILALLVVISITLLVISTRGTDEAEEGSSFLGSILGPIESAAATVTSPIRSLFESVTNLGDKDERIRELEARIDELESQDRTRELLQRRAEEVAELLNVAALGQYRTVPAQVIAFGPRQDFAWAITIDAGTIDGIAPNMTVLTGKGLVGKVVQVSANNAIVQLLVDRRTTVGGRISPTMDIGAIQGLGSTDELHMDLYVDDPFKEIPLDSPVVTFGSKDGAPYVPGVPIGEIVSVKEDIGQLNRSVTVRPYVDFTTLDIVGVVIEPPRTDPRDSVLPKAPATTTPESPSDSQHSTEGSTDPADSSPEEGELAP